MKPWSWLEIDFDGLAANVTAWRDHLRRSDGATALCAVCKADAYGLGAGEIAPAVEAAGADVLAVYDLGEAEQLFQAGVSSPVLVLSPLGELGPRSRDAACRGRLHWVCDSLEHLAVLDRLGTRLAAALPVHLYVDTGMSRGGLAPDALGGALRRASATGRVRIAGLSTHFATADGDPARMEEQWQRFAAALRAHRELIPGDAMIHADNTCAALRAEHPHRSMARIGLGLYGLGGEMLPAEARSDTPKLTPVLRWKARLAHCRSYPAGATVGYGATRRLERDSLLGVLPVGYADGYPAALGNRGGAVAPDGTHAPVIGRVNMDQIVVDLTDAAEPRVGDVLTLYSADPTSPCAIPRLAELAETHSYELLCRLSSRLPRYAVATRERATPRTPASAPAVREA